MQQTIVPGVAMWYPFFIASSQKLLVEQMGHLLRDRAILDYYDGE